MNVQENDYLYHAYLGDDDEPVDLFTFLSVYGKPETIHKGDYLYHQNDPHIPDVILLRTGSVKACQDSPAGEEQIFNVFGSGSVLFLLAAIRQSAPDLNFIAVSNCQALRIPTVELQSFLVTDARFCTLVLLDISAQLEHSYKRLRESESYGAEWKICNMLLTFAARSGTDYDGKILIREKISQQTMASMLRVSRITVARTLKLLRDVGLIETVNGYTCIRDEEKLRQHMYYISLPLE